MSDDDWDETPSASNFGGNDFGSSGFGGGFKTDDDTNSNSFGDTGFSKNSEGDGGHSNGAARGFVNSSVSGCRKCGANGHLACDCPTGNRGGEGGRACHKCGEEGHLARECPKGGGGVRRACHKCGEEGHFSRDCKSGTSNRSGFGRGFRSDKANGFQGGGFRSSFGGDFGGFGGDDDTAGGGGGFGSSSVERDDTCRICKQRGHFARDCQDRPERDKCRRCGESGHFAKDCTQPPVLDPDRPAPVTYIPPEPSDQEENLYQTIAQGINFENYDNIPVEVTGPGSIPTAIRSFAEADLPEIILENVKKANYVKPTPVQKYALPIILADRDLMSCAQTGSGKTASFLLPVLASMMNYKNELSSQLSEVQAPLALVISPTRELAIQIHNEARKFSSGTGIRPVVVYGGVSVRHQLQQVTNGCHLLVGTPGRLKDFVSKRQISLANIKYLVLDEADRMLDMGFMPDVKAIIREFGMPPKGDRRTLMFSATFPEQIQKLAGEFLSDYLFVTIGKVGSTHSDIEQNIIEVDEASKRDKLVELLTQEGGNKNLVFVQTKRSADFLASYLSQNGFPTTSIHGDRFQQQREEALRDFRRGEQTVLIATAVAARGLDIADVKQVVNYDLPDEIEEYVHRIGRTGRIGNKGRAVSFFTRGKDEVLARALVKTLADSEQVVPDWLEEVAETAIGTGYGPKNGSFASKDTRAGAGRNDGGRRFNPVERTDGYDNSNGFSNSGIGSFTGGGDEEWD